jgi:hypothetical protein
LVVLLIYWRFRRFGKATRSRSFSVCEARPTTQNVAVPLIVRDAKQNGSRAPRFLAEKRKIARRFVDANQYKRDLCISVAYTLAKLIDSTIPFDVKLALFTHLIHLLHAALING